jgi:hypothetical protein
MFWPGCCPEGKKWAYAITMMSVCVCFCGVFLMTIFVPDDGFSRKSLKVLISEAIPISFYLIIVKSPTVKANEIFVWKV